MPRRARVRQPRVPRRGLRCGIAAPPRGHPAVDPIAARSEIATSGTRSTSVAVVRGRATGVTGLDPLQQLPDGERDFPPPFLFRLEMPPPGGGDLIDTRAAL